VYLLPPPLRAAAADAAGGIDFTVFAQYGILGVIAAMLIWFARGAHQRERDRADRLEAEVQRLHALMLDRVIPALTSATSAAEESTALLQSWQRERELSNLVNLRRTTEGPS
jgi:hypothetical protein